ncbi:hypothetical protein ACFSTC_46835 [Nonomuraea ferruginea]
MYDHARYTWSDHDWKGRDLRGGVIYELHIGTFTPEGTFQAAAGRLDHLAELCVDFVEIMPVAPVPGTRNWGYDGVDLYAVNETYGGPDGLKTFADACHRARHRRHPRRGLQPPGAVGQLPAPVRPVLRRVRGELLGRGGQPGRARLRRGAPLLHRERVAVAARLPRRRPAAGRRARAARQARHPPAGRARRGGGRAVVRDRPSR